MDRSPEVIREEIEQVRGDMSLTAARIGDRLDVASRARDYANETANRAASVANETAHRASSMAHRMRRELLRTSDEATAAAESAGNDIAVTMDLRMAQARRDARRMIDELQRSPALAAAAGATIGMLVLALRRR